MNGATSSMSAQSVNPSSLPPLEALLPLASQFLALLQSSSTFLWHSTRWIFAKLHYSVVFLTPLYYFFIPVVILVQASLDMLVFTPYRVLAYLLNLLYPIYVLVGVACMVGIVVGGVGRLISLKIALAIKPKKVRKQISFMKEQ